MTTRRRDLPIVTLSGAAGASLAARKALQNISSYKKGLFGRKLSRAAKAAHFGKSVGKGAFYGGLTAAVLKGIAREARKEVGR